MFNVVVLSTEMEGDADERAEGEVAAVTLHQLRQQKFLTRMASMILKALLIAAAVALLPSLLGQFSALLNFCRRALLTRAWDIVYLILVGVAVSYGVLARGRPGLGEPEGRDSDGGDSYVAKLFDFGGTFADYGDGDRPAHAGDAEPSDPAGGEEPNPIDGRSSPSDEVDLVGKRYARALDGPVSGSNPGPGIGKLEANFGSPVASEKDWSAEKAKRRHSAPPAPAVPVEDRDSNPGPRPERAERKPPILPPPPPPRPPPPLAPAPRASRGENAAQIATGTESFERKEKGKSEKSEKMVPPPPPPPPPPPTPLVPPPPAVPEGGLNPKHESKHRRSKSKEDSKHRSKDESKHRSAGKEIANALGLFSQSERKQAKIPAPPAPPPLPSALQQWFSSYRRESKHRSKDSEPSPRPRSERASRKVHSSSSPPSPPPLPPPPRLPPVYTVDGANASKFSSKPARDGASASKNSTRPRRDETSGSKDSSKPGRDEASRSKDSSGARDRASGGQESSAKPRMDEKPKAAGDGASAIRDLSKPGKEDMAGSVPELKAVEKSARRKSTSIPLPPPPPPHFAMEEEHWSMYDLPKHRKMSSSPVVLWEESAASEPESEHDPEPAIRRQVSLDGTESQFCPSPSPDEVNRKAEAFIARFHEQIRLQKMNSIRERLDRGSR